MQTVTKHIREHLLLNLGYRPAVQRMPPLESLREHQWCEWFEELRRNRMVLGAFRYGLLEHQASNGSPYNNVDSLIRRAQAYQRTGNTECLVDVANLAMIEFMIGRHPRKHFASVDDGEHTTTRPSD